MLQTKQCTQCNEIKTLNNFDKHSTSNDGYQYYCKPCKWKKYGSKSTKKWILKQKQTANGFLGYLLSQTKRRNGRKEKQVSITIEDLKELYKKQKGMCAISGLEMTFGAHDKYTRSNNYNISIDRIDSSIGYTKDNIQLVCSIINSMKNDFNQEDFLKVCLIIVQNKNYLK